MRSRAMNPSVKIFTFDYLECVPRDLCYAVEYHIVTVRTLHVAVIMA